MPWQVPEAAGNRFLISTPGAVRIAEISRLLAAAYPDLQIRDLGDPVILTYEPHVRALHMSLIYEG